MRSFFIAVVWALVASGAGSWPGTAAAAPPATAPPFVTRTLDGRLLRLSDFKGQPVVLDFWATWCGPCRASLPELDQLQEHMRDRGLVVIGLSVDDGPAIAVRRYVNRMGLRFRIGMAEESVLDDYGPIRSIPTTFFINRRGGIVRRVVGYVDAETMENFAREIVGR